MPWIPEVTHAQGSPVPICQSVVSSCWGPLLFFPETPSQLLLYPTGMIPLFLVPYAIFFHGLSALQYWRFERAATKSKVGLSEQDAAPSPLWVSRKARKSAKAHRSTSSGTPGSSSRVLG